MDTPQPRLNKYLAEKLGLSRRRIDEMIERGRITVNGQPAALGARLSATSQLAVDGQVVTIGAAIPYAYLLFNKPTGYVCSRRQQGETPTIYSLLPDEYHQLKPVGRLDKDSSGLILLTNDGDFAHRMTHPSFHKVKIYTVTLDRPLEPLHRQMISDHGITLPDGASSFMIEKLDQPNRYQITMHEGRNRQIRRTFAALGYDVTHLHRTTFGPYLLGELKAGAFRAVTKN